MSDYAIANVGVDGEKFAGYHDALVRLLPENCIAYVTGGTSGANDHTWQKVDATHGLPVNVVGGMVDVSSLATATNQTTELALLTTISSHISKCNTDLTLIEGTHSHGSVLSGNPVQIGGVAQATTPTPLGFSDLLTRAWYSLYGSSSVFLCLNNGSILPGDATNGIYVNPRQLPPGASTSTNQVTGNTLLTSIDSHIVACNTGAVTITSLGLVDMDTGGATETKVAVGLLLAESGGSLIVGSAHPLPISGSVSQSGTWSVQQNGIWTVGLNPSTSLPSGGNLIGSVGLSGGANLVGKVGIDQTTNGTTNAVVDIPCITGGLSVSSFLSTAAVQSTSVKGSAGQVYSLEFFNIGATPVYVRLYNKATADDGSGTPVWRGIVPGNTAGAGFVKSWEKGLAFAAGIAMRCTGAIADNDTTALAANTIIGNVNYK